MNKWYFVLFALLFLGFAKNTFAQLTNLQSGDYWYIIKLNGIQDTREFIDHFTLYR